MIHLTCWISQGVCGCVVGLCSYCSPTKNTNFKCLNVITYNITKTDGPTMMQTTVVHSFRRHPGTDLRGGLRGPWPHRRGAYRAAPNNQRSGDARRHHPDIRQQARPSRRCVCVCIWHFLSLLVVHLIERTSAFSHHKSHLWCWITITYKFKFDSKDSIIL